MSLINDALKRAQKAQSQTPPPAPQSTDLRPAEPASYAWHGIGLLLPAALALVALLTLFLVWEMSRQRTADVRASTAPRMETPAPASVPTAPADSAPVQGTPPRPNGAVPATASSSAQNPTTPVTNTPAADEVAKPLPPKLQAVIYNPRNPSAVINGRTVFRGDRLGELRVVKITPDSATLVGQGQTNLLFLEH